MNKDTIEVKKEDFAVFCTFVLDVLHERNELTQEGMEYVLSNREKFESLVIGSKMHTFEEVKVYLDKLFKE